MNELTKQELQYLIHLWHVCNSYHNSPPENLKIKIQSMIDNYCEHQWASYFNANGSQVRCLKCHKSLIG